MAKKIFKETSRFNGVLFYSMVSLFIVLVASQLFKLLFIAESIAAGQLLFFSILLVSLIGLIWYFTNLQMKLSISQKAISYQLKPFHPKKKRIPLEEVKSYRVVKTPIDQQFQGANITFNNEKRFSTNGRNGVEIQTQNGDIYFLGANQHEKLKSALDRVFNKA